METIAETGRGPASFLSALRAAAIEVAVPRNCPELRTCGKASVACPLLLLAGDDSRSGRRLS